MLKFGGWNTNVPRDKYPQKIASAISNLQSLVGIGCEYNVIAYLGNQQVNGINHAVLAEQTVMNGKDTKNAVVIVFNEKPDSMDVVVTDIRRVVESGGDLGGVKIEMTTDIPEEAKAAFEKALANWTGTKIEPFAYVGSKVTKGTNYIFAAEVTPVVPNAKSELMLVVINPMITEIGCERLLEIGSNDSQEQKASFGYAFTWLTK